MSDWKKHWSKKTFRHADEVDFEHEPRKRKIKMNRIVSRIDQSATATKPTSASKTNPQRDFMTTAEAADFLRLSPRTLERFRVEGTGPRYTKAGPGKRARVLYRHDDLTAWLEGFQYGSTAEYES